MSRELMEKQKVLSHELQILKDQLLIADAECQIKPLRDQIQAKISELSNITLELRNVPLTYGRRATMVKRQESHQAS